MADDPQPTPQQAAQAHLDLHRALHLHDAVIDDLNELWHLAHPGGEEPWDEP